MEHRSEALTAERMLLEQEPRQLGDERIAAAEDGDTRVLDLELAKPAERPRYVSVDDSAERALEIPSGADIFRAGRGERFSRMQSANSRIAAEGLRWFSDPRSNSAGESAPRMISMRFGSMFAR
jgi:hypothetical protein